MHLSYACDNEHRHIFPHVLQDTGNLHPLKRTGMNVLCIKSELGGKQQLLLGKWKQGREDRTQESCWINLCSYYPPKHVTCTAVSHRA